MNKKIYPLLSVYGIELEYMIVDKTSLKVLPIADKLIQSISGKIQNEYAWDDDIAISNELALHVIELKTNGPKASLDDLSEKFYKKLQIVNEHLQQFNAKTMPTGAHPWLDPKSDINLWPHGDQIIYSTYHKIFNCSGHGWGNLQSTHLNLPFANDAEFKILHSAIRLLLPIIPALTASTPILDGKISHVLDTRLLYYGQNQKLIPQIAGQIIPEYVCTQQEYQEKILNPMYAAIAHLDTEKTLQAEWLNSRGAIARFERNAIEIRIIDLQEAPLADIACIAAITAVLKAWATQQADHIHENISTEELKLIYDSVIEAGMKTQIANKTYLKCLGLTSEKPLLAKEIWYRLVENIQQSLPLHYKKVIFTIINQGNLAERILKSLSHCKINRETLTKIYNELINCLETNQLFLP